MQTTYVLVSPCKDEAEYIEKTLRSIARQTVKPAQWVIVDDGSRDDSMTIVAQYQAELPFIKVVHRDSGARKVGAGVIEAFNAGLAAVDVPHDFICKFDVDLELPDRYFEIMLARMAADPRLGTCSGKAYYRHPRTGAPVSELCGDETSVGMIKFYRRACFEAIGGFVSDNGWDMFDGHQARWHGWRATSWDDPEIRFIHLRPMGSSQKSIYHGRARHGDAQYRIGSHPLFFAAAALNRAVRQPPYLTGAGYFVAGYLRAMLSGTRRLGDEDFTRFLRRYQLRALRTGKREAAEWAFRERARALERGLPDAAPEPT
jgi:glycosyltransferase involved in cell wall biosynthesis